MQFDADTIYTETYVYAEIYVSADGTAWEHLYSTEDFPIWGSDPDDDYEVETELVSGYSTGLYDVLIELYDADTGELARRVRAERVAAVLAGAARGLGARRRSSSRRRPSRSSTMTAAAARSRGSRSRVCSARSRYAVGASRRSDGSRRAAAAGIARRRCSILRALDSSSGARVRFKPIGLALAALVAVSFAASSFAQPRTPPREITQVEGDLYRARNGNWYTVFLVTPAGIILGDPINESFRRG